MCDIKNKVERFVNHLQMELRKTENNLESQLSFLQNNKPEWDRMITNIKKELVLQQNFEKENRIEVKKKKKKKSKKEIKIVLYKFKSQENPTAEVIQKFLIDTINVPVVIKNTARLGKEDDSPILITLENKEDRKMIFGNLKHFKKYHEMGMKYSICDEMSKSQQNRKVPKYYENKYKQSNEESEANDVAEREILRSKSKVKPVLSKENCIELHSHSREGECNKEKIEQSNFAQADGLKQQAVHPSIATKNATLPRFIMQGLTSFSTTFLKDGKLRNLFKFKKK